MGHSFTVRFPGAALAYARESAFPWRYEMNADDTPAFRLLIRGLPVFLLIDFCFKSMNCSK